MELQELNWPLLLLLVQMKVPRQLANWYTFFYNKLTVHLARMISEYTSVSHM